MVSLQFGQIRVVPGQRVILDGVSWEDFESILAELGEDRGSRVVYFDGVFELMSPLPEHERAKILIGDFVKVLLDELGWDWESLGSTTFKSPDMNAGIEPDDCFYIQNYSSIIGKDRINLSVDPPPDLAIEIDVTSQTQVSAYKALNVPEIWRYFDGNLEISLLGEDGYMISSSSSIFPGFPVVDMIPHFVNIGRSQGMSRGIKGFREWVKGQL